MLNNNDHNQNEYYDRNTIDNDVDDTEALTLGSSAVGAAIGTALGGPIGTIVGGVVGGILGNKLDEGEDTNDNEQT